MRYGQSFTPGSPAHWVAVGAIIAASVAVCLGGEFAQRRGVRCRRRFELWLAAALLAVWVAVQVRYLTPNFRRWDCSLPLQLCNVVNLFAPFAVRTPIRYFRAVVFHVGLGICPVAIIAPALHDGFARPDYWFYWGYHGAITAAAFYICWISGYRPNWRDWRMAAGTILVFVPLVLFVDVTLNADYAFLGNPAHSPAAVRAFGPWPLRDVWMTFTAIASMFILCGLGQLAANTSAVTPWNPLGNAPRPLTARPSNTPEASPALRTAA